MKKVCIFGASSFGEKAYRCLQTQYRIAFFVDNNSTKWGNMLCNTEIISPQSLPSIHKECTVVIASQYDLAISQQLIEIGIKKFGVFSGELNKIQYFDYSNKDIKKKKNKISIITSNYSGSNSYALYKSIPIECNNKYEIVLVNEKEKDENYYLDLMESTLVIHNHSNFFDETKINVQLWHGFPLKTLSYMSHYPKEVKIKNNLEWCKLDAVASYSTTYNTLMNACYGINGEKYTITGMPRNDMLLTSNGRENLSKVLNLSLDNKKVIMYMPTFRESLYGLKSGNESTYSIFDMEDFDLKKLDRFLTKINSIMILKFHPFNLKQALDYLNFQELNNIHALEDTELMDFNFDLYEIMNAVDLLITDYSSIYFDYLLLDRPIVFTPLDLEDYKKNTGFLIEPYDFWAPGPKCLTIEELEKNIEKCFCDNNYFKRERNIVRDIVHHYNDANSSKRVWDLIDDLMGNNK